MVEARMVTTSTQLFWFSRQVVVLRADRIAPSSHGLALELITPDADVSSGDLRRDRVGDRDRAPRHVGVQALDHAALELDHALAFVLRQVEGGDDLLRLRDVVLARR